MSKHKEATQYIKATLAAFGPDEAISMTKETWTKLHEAMTTLVAQPAQPVAWCVLEPWLSGKFEPQDCFSDVEVDANVGWVPLYTSPQTQPPQEFVCSTGLCHYKAQPRGEATLARDPLTDEQTAQQSAERGEPVAWLYPDNLGRKVVWLGAKRPIMPRPWDAVPLYITPQAQPAREPLTYEENSKLFDSLIDEMLNHSYQGSQEAAEEVANEIKRMYKAAHGITKGTP